MDTRSVRIHGRRGADLRSRRHRHEGWPRGSRHRDGGLVAVRGEATRSRPIGLHRRRGRPRHRHPRFCDPERWIESICRLRRRRTDRPRNRDRLPRSLLPRGPGDRTGRTFGSPGRWPQRHRRRRRDHRPRPCRRPPTCELTRPAPRLGNLEHRADRRRAGHLGGRTACDRQLRPPADARGRRLRCGLLVTRRHHRSGHRQ